MLVFMLFACLLLCDLFVTKGYKDLEPLLFVKKTLAYSLAFCHMNFFSSSNFERELLLLQKKISTDLLFDFEIVKQYLFLAVLAKMCFPKCEKNCVKRICWINRLTVNQRLTLRHLLFKARKGKLNELC